MDMPVKIGQAFTYLGVSMICIAHRELKYLGLDFCYVNYCVVANYFGNGELKRVSLEPESYPGIVPCGPMQITKHDL